MCIRLYVHVYGRVCACACVCVLVKAEAAEEFDAGMDIMRMYAACIRIMHMYAGCSHMYAACMDIMRMYAACMHESRRLKTLEIANKVRSDVCTCLTGMCPSMAQYPSNMCYILVAGLPPLLHWLIAQTAKTPADTSYTPSMVWMCCKCCRACVCMIAACAASRYHCVHESLFSHTHGCRYVYMKCVQICT